MQPYFFPYVGYFQLISAVDRFVIYDDVQFIKGGWINRNRILVNGKPTMLTIPLANASPNKRIDEIELLEPARNFERLTRTVCQSYARAPYVRQTTELLTSIFASVPSMLHDLLRESLKAILAHLQIETDLVESSAKYGNSDLRSEARIVDICLRENALEYVNAPGGRSLYDPASFAAHGIQLSFLAPTCPPYDQLSGPFQSHLSLIDVLMYNPVESVREMLDQYRVEPA